ncbi:MAG: hypothetical protein AB7I37_12235 [Pirellulales bacterium]
MSLFDRLAETWSGLFPARSNLEQHIAVFGESGSGKTTLLSVFYGYQQAREFRKTAGYSLLATATGQGNKLLEAYYNIEKKLVPPFTRFQHSIFDFQIKAEGVNNSVGTVVWHDYPGEWWTETVEGDEEQRRRIAFRALMQSDVAFLLVDGKKLAEHGATYVKKLLANFRDFLDRERKVLLDDQDAFQTFPRIWTICLSKADLFPDHDVEWFRKQVLTAARSEIDDLSEAIMGFIPEKKRESLSFGEDFLLLSSAKFEPTTNQIVDPTKTIGVDQITPLGCLSLMRHIHSWVNKKKVAVKTAHGAGELLRAATTHWMKWIPIVGRFFQLLDEVAKGQTDSLNKTQEKAKERGDHVMHVVVSFERRIREAEANGIYLSGDLIRS